VSRGRLVRSYSADPRGRPERGDRWSKGGRPHLGLSLRPAFRGLGLGTDTVAVLCRYGFTVLGLHRLQIDTLADNTAMIHAATRNGFVHEGTLRRAAWVLGTFIDEVILGRLAQE
jgi:RimJ/RimL family protein N-acetyltransferase